MISYKSDTNQNLRIKKWWKPLADFVLQNSLFCLCAAALITEILLSAAAAAYQIESSI